MPEEPTRTDYKQKAEELEALYHDIEHRYQDALNQLNAQKNVSVQSIAGLDQKVVQVDDSLRILYINTPFARSLGFSKDELTGAELSRVDNFPWGPGYLEVLVRQCGHLKEPLVKERNFFDLKAGQEVVVRITVTPVEGGTQLVLEDRTEYAALQRRFARYVSPKVLEAMKAMGSDFEAPRRQSLTVMFVDLRGFTTLSEQMSPEQAHETLNIYLTTMISIVEASDAMVDKIMGDELLVLCGAPLPRKDHSLQALKIAFEMVRTHEQLMAAMARDGRTLPHIGIGMNSGEVTVGNLGTDKRSDYTVLGHQVNVAARLCQAAREGEILASHATLEELVMADSSVTDKIRFSKIDSLDVKGFRDPVLCYRVMSVGADRTDITLTDLPPEAVIQAARQKRVFGRYQLLGEIGRGGMGVVYKAIHTDMGKVVALKFLKVGDLAQETQLKMFQREIESLATLQHPHIIAIHDVGVVEGQRYFAMDYIDGCSLEEILGELRQDSARQRSASMSDMVTSVREHKKDAPPGASTVRLGKPRGLNITHALTLMAKILRALEHAHSRGVVHRDLKPSNIMITREGEPVVMDFGLARQTRTTESVQAMSGQIIGTPAYMSPEQADGLREKINEKSDVYSAGALFYEMLTGRTPIPSQGSLVDDLRAIVEREPMRVRQVNPGVPRELEVICHKAMEKEQERRYRTAGAFAEDLQRYINGDPILARPQGLVYRAKKKIAKHRVEFASACLMLLFLFAAFAYRQYSHRAMHEKENALTLERAKAEARWILAYENNFDSGPLDSVNWFYRYPQLNTLTYGIEKGALVLRNSGSLYSTVRVPGNIRLVFDAAAEGKNEINVRVKCAPTYGDSDWFYGAFWAENVFVIERKGMWRDRTLSDFNYHQQAFAENINDRPGVWHHFEISFEDGFFRLLVDGRPYVEGRDYFALVNSDNSRWGFRSIIGALRIDNLKVYRQLLPERVEVTQMANAYLERGDARGAGRYLLNLLLNYPNPAIVEQSLRKILAIARVDTAGSAYRALMNDRECVRKILDLSDRALVKDYLQWTLWMTREKGVSDTGSSPLDEYAKGLEPAARLRLFVYLGIAFAGPGTEALSRAAFRSALVLRPDSIVTRCLEQGMVYEKRAPRNGQRYLCDGYLPWSFGECRKINAFYMDSTEVTQGEYLELMGNNPSYYNGVTPDNEKAGQDPRRPVEGASWYDAVRFCNQRSLRDRRTPCYRITNVRDTLVEYTQSKLVDGFDVMIERYVNMRKRWPLFDVAVDTAANGYRLPTEDEFEYALRGGTATRYFWGNDLQGGASYAWSSANSEWRTHPVAAKRPNAFGLYDIAGNVWEYCWSGDRVQAMIRGASFMDDQGASGDYRELRANKVQPMNRNTGFRCVSRP